MMMYYAVLTAKFQKSKKEKRKSPAPALIQPTEYKAEMRLIEFLERRVSLNRGQETLELTCRMGFPRLSHCHCPADGCI